MGLDDQVGRPRQFDITAFIVFNVGVVERQLASLGWTDAQGHQFGGHRDTDHTPKGELVAAPGPPAFPVIEAEANDPTRYPDFDKSRCEISGSCRVAEQKPGSVQS